MLLLFLALLLIGILPSFLLASHRQYADVRGWLNDLEPRSQKYHQDMEFTDLDEEDIWDILDEGEPAPEPSIIADILLGMFTGVCMLIFVYGILQAIRRVFQDFRNSRDENGDIIEEIQDKGRTDREELLGKGRRHTDSAAEKIKRRYRKMIRIHREDRPAPYESPAEIEEGAGLQDDEEMRELHRAYEEVRYGPAE